MKTFSRFKCKTTAYENYKRKNMQIFGYILRGERYEYHAYCYRAKLTAREDDKGTPGSVTPETGWKLIMLLWLESHKITISGDPWSPKSKMDMEPVIDWLIDWYNHVSN